VTKKLSFIENAIKHAKGIPYLVDCNVTGSNPGTPTKPCFPLKALWEHYLIPSVFEQLVATGGPCAGAFVILQEDNAGPHTEGNYRKWLTEAFTERQWRIELQAPQGRPLPFFNHWRSYILTLILVSLQVLIAMFLTSACSRQFRIDIAHTYSSVITQRPV
jgi:hypothetical protein